MHSIHTKSVEFSSDSHVLESTWKFRRVLVVIGFNLEKSLLGI